VKDEPLMQLQEMEIFAHHQADTINELAQHLECRHFGAGATIYARGTPGDELYWVRRGIVRQVALLEANRTKPVATFGRGDVFGGLAFMDAKPRPHDAVALTDADVYVLTRERFEQLATVHHKLAFNLATEMARTFAMRLRRAERKINMLQES
jgi:SulP family sulfate permease